MSPKRLSTVIRGLRDAKGITQRDLAARVGVKGAYIAQLETGARKNPSLDVLKRLAKAPGVPLAGLLGGRPRAGGGGRPSPGVCPLPGRPPSPPPRAPRPTWPPCGPAWI